MSERRGLPPGEPLIRTVNVVALILIIIVVIGIIVIFFTQGSGGDTSECQSDDQCSPGVCDQGKCVECVFNSDCVGTATCEENVCVAPPPPPDVVCACPAVVEPVVDEWPESGGGRTIIMLPDGVVRIYLDDFEGPGTYVFDYNPSTGMVTEFTAPGSATDVGSEMTAAAYYPPLGEWIAAFNNGELWSFDPDTMVATFINDNSHYHRALIVTADSRVFATSVEGDVSLFEYNTMTWEFSTIGEIFEDDGGGPETISVALGAVYHPDTESVYLSYSTFAGTSGVGILDLETAQVTPTCLEDSDDLGRYAEIVVDQNGGMYFAPGSNRDHGLYYLPSPPCESETLPNFSL